MQQKYIKGYDKMITKKMNIGNRDTYDILVIDGISDTIGNVAILRNNRENDPYPYVIAYGYDMENGTWANGSYFRYLADTKKSFYNHIKNI